MRLPHIGLLLLGAAAMGAGCGPGRTPAGQPPLATITPDAIDAMRTAFNQAADETRVILLLSPT